MKTKIYPNLPHLQSIKRIMQYPMKFPDTLGGVTTSFSICNKSIDVGYEVIRKDLYDRFTIIYLEKMKVNIKNYLQVTFEIIEQWKFLPNHHHDFLLYQFQNQFTLLLKF